MFWSVLTVSAEMWALGEDHSMSGKRISGSPNLSQAEVRFRLTKHGLELQVQMGLCMNPYGR